MITKADLKEAFEAGARFQGAEAAEIQRRFQAWLSWFCTCRDCGRDTSLERIHCCPARAKPTSPYREKP